ncbi:hypothetical protein ACFW95_37390 [Streptomyces sp. NPDC059474]|uniref:hypothetical protein n=1 Tax=Streptomyces sp. NPDC059474 TaxID=3346846 RepID=UPI00368F249D
MPDFPDGPPAAAVADMLRTRRTARVRAAWGSGKTILAAETANRIAPDGTALVFIPDEEHLVPTAHAWRRYRRAGETVILTGGRGRHDELPAGIRQTGTARELATLVADTRGPLTVFTTYRNKPALQAAHREHDVPAWDILIAHLDLSDKAPWADLHKHALWPARHRLYLSAARQRHTGASIFTRRTRRRRPASVDEIGTYGPLAWDRTFSSAVDEIQLRDYYIVVADAFDSTLPFEFDSDTDASRRTQLLLNSVEALRVNDLPRCVFFTDGDDTSRHYAQYAIPAAIACNVWSGDHTSLQRMRRHTLLEHDTPDQRSAALDAFNRTRTHEPGTSAVLFCTPKALAATSSLTPPAVDAAVIGHPDYSSAELTSTVRQALRPVVDSTHPVALIVPVAFPKETPPDRSLLSSPAYEPASSLLRILVSHDDRIANEESLLQRITG